MLPLGAAEVSLDVVVARADVLQGVRAVEMLRTRQDRHPLVAVQIRDVDVVGIEVVEHRVGHDDVDAAQLVDHPDQTLQSDPGVLINMDMEVPLDRGDCRRRPPVGVRRIDLRAAAGRQRHPEVARNGEHGHMPAGRLDTDQDHRLGQHVIRIELRIVVRSE